MANHYPKLDGLDQVELTEILDVIQKRAAQLLQWYHENHQEIYEYRHLSFVGIDMTHLLYEGWVESRWNPDYQVEYALPIETLFKDLTQDPRWICEGGVWTKKD